MASTKAAGPVLVVAATLGACFSFSAGQKFDTTHVSDIRRCVTTEADLLAWFGEPYQRGNTDGLPTLQWLYAHEVNSRWRSESLAAIVNSSGKVVHFAFNPGNAVVEAKDTCGIAGDASAR